MSFRLAAFSTLTIFGAIGRLFAQGNAAADEAVKGKTSVLDFTLPDLSGKETPLATYKGKVILMVNVASRCGLTPQYEQLQAVYGKYQSKGLVILGFPANNFLGQEPGSNDEIGAFCKKNYGVTFPIYSKISVKGSNQAPLYRFLTGNDTNPGFAGPISWNFEKFLVDRNGKVVARFSPKVKPDAPEVMAAIEKHL